MSKQTLPLFLSGLIGALAVTPQAAAVNRFIVNNTTLQLGSTGNVIPVLADVDQNTYGFSVHIQYDASKIQVTEVQLGAATMALNPEYNEGTISNSPGRIVHGVVFDTSGPTITKNLTPGAGKEVLKLVVNVVAATSTTVVLDFANTAGNPSRLNVMTNSNGDSVSPAPTLVDGTLTLSGPIPQIDSFQNNSGPVGHQFKIIGQNFQHPGLVVRVCGKTATHTVDNPTTLNVTAPDCVAGPALVEVCTNFGCDSDPAGFTYANEDAPEILTIFDNVGTAGAVFNVVGSNFDAPGLAVEVCGVSATFTLLVDDSLDVTAPACPQSGFQPLEVCTNNGCDTEQNGFNYTGGAATFIRGNVNTDTSVNISDPVAILNDLFLGQRAPAVCRDALDSDDSGRLDITDAVYILNFLFQGGTPIPAPYPNPGTDPTADALPGC
jgi:hypothetical protein